MKRSLALFIINYFLISCIICLNVDPCKRQPFRGRCPVSSNGIQARSQFVLRYYLRNGECVSYPYGHCANDENEPKLYRYKEECQEACIDKKETEIISHSNKDSPIRFSPTKTIINGNNNVEETYETNKSIIETSSSKILTKCEKERIISKDVFKLECDSDGNYKMLQCNAEKQECFCVDEMGKEIPYSRSSPNGVAPDCTTIIKVEKKLFNKCTGKSVYGPCKANLTRWYFEESENKCKSFQYSGCGSNGNNYENELACIDRCIPKKTTTSSEDESHTTISKINTNTICSLPKERGPCDRYDLRFYYNKDLNECKYFFYGGCEGNSNNFIKVEDCEATCGGKPSQTQELLPKNPNNITPEPKIFQTITTKKIHIETTFSQKPIITTTEYPFTENRCLPPKDSGNCNGNFVRWYWNNERKICETFSYSGCAGNSNNFANREECLSICHINAASKDNENEILNPFDVCSHKIDQGECGGNFLRWAFDKKSGNCIKMRYTGCMGNGNNFATEEDCARKCIPGRKPTQQSPACFHSIDVGDCDGVFPRFGYDKNTNECKQYTYSGCNGSPNNFGTYQDCAEACIRLSCPPVTNCDLTRCHILQDVNGCSSCNCPPIVNKNPVINPPPFPIPTKNSNNCPVVDASSCVEPCMIFFNRIGCQECVCPKVPTTEIPIVKSTTNSVIPIVKTSTSSEIVRNKVDAKIQNTLTSQKPIIEKEKPTFQSPSSFEPKKNNEDINSIDNGFVPIVPSFKDVVGDKCTLPVDPGPCKDFIERWYFNINTGLCEPFKFGGCGGSKNHFFTRHECEVHCARFASITSLAPHKNIISLQKNIIKPPPLSILHSPNTFNNTILIPPKITIKPIIKKNENNNVILKKDDFQNNNEIKKIFNNNKSSIPTSTFLRNPVVINVIKKIQKEEEIRPVDIIEKNDSEETAEIKQQLVSRGIWIPESMVSNNNKLPVQPTISMVEETTNSFDKETLSTVKTKLNDQSLEILSDSSNQLMWIQNVNPKTGEIKKIHPDEIKPLINGAIGSVMWVKRWNNNLNKYELINPSQYAFEEYQKRLKLDEKDSLQINIPSSSMMPAINFTPQWTTTNLNIFKNNHKSEILSNEMTFENKININKSQENTPTTNNQTIISFENISLLNKNSLFIPTPKQFPLNTINSEQKPIILDNNQTNNNSQVMWINVWNEETKSKEIIGISKDLLQKSTTRIVLESVTVAPGKILKPPTNENISLLTSKNQDNLEKDIVFNFIKNIEKNNDNMNEITSIIPIKKIISTTNKPILIKDEKIGSKNSIIFKNEKTDIPLINISNYNFTTLIEKFSTKLPIPIDIKSNKPNIYATKMPDISPLVTIFEEMVISDDSIYYLTNDKKNKKNNDSFMPFDKSKQSFNEEISISKIILPENKKLIESTIENVSFEKEENLDKKELTTEIPPQLLNKLFFKNNTMIKEKGERLETKTDKPMSKVYLTTLPFEKNYKSLNIETFKKDKLSILHTSTNAPLFNFTEGLSTKQSFISQHTIAPQINTIKPQHNTVQFSQPIKQLNEEIVDICNLPADAGHCFNYIPRWYFNSQKGKCEQFSYGSCGGNKNNFFDKNSCEAKCITVILPKVFSSLPKECTYERDEGFGGEYHPKYYFNFKNLHCEQMIYQGQGGNDNRFDNKIKCENICINRINENNNKLRPLPVQQPSTFVPQSKSTEKWNNNNTLNLFNNNVKGIKIAESVDNNGNTGKTAPIKMIETETSQISVPVPSLENYQQQYNAKPYQTTENVNIPESHHSSIEIKSTTVPENGGYPEVSLISSQSTDVTNIPQTTTLLTTQSYETTENIKNEEIKSTTLEKEVEAHIDPKNTQTIDIIKKLPEEIKTSKSDILISTTDIPTYVSTIGSEDIKPKFEVNINTVPTVKIIQTTDTPTTVKETIPVVSNTENVNKAIETLTTEHIETELTTELPTILTTNEKQTISTTKLQTEIPTQTQSVVENSIQPQITTTIQTESTDTTEIETKKGEILETTPSSSISPNIPSSGSKIETISKITEIENVSSGDRSIKKLDIRPISPTTTIKNIPTELITEKTTIKLETSTISEPSTHNQSIEDDKDLLETNELSKKDAVENKDEYKANTLTEKIINKVPKEQLPIVKESPDPKINYQNRGGNVINGILNQPISKDSQTLEELIPKVDTRIPVCPNKKPALIDRIGNPLSCLPGKKLCPEKSSCIFNGVNFYCCPSPEDPYDHHVFGGYNGEEIKNGYKPLTKTLNILSIANHEPIKRAKRQSMGLDNIYKSLRFEGAPIKQISRANRLHVNGKMLPICNLEVERGNCGESHVRYFYDARIDQCRMFYYSGCQGNGNNFENQLDCERICKIEVNENSKILKDEKKFLNVCGEGMTPFGGENPLVCGNENDSIGCPVGYFCRKSSPFICCPKIVEDNDDINQLTIKDIIAKKTGKDTRFAPKINSTYDLHRSNLPRLRTSSGIVVPSSSNICPDGSDSLKEVLTGKPVDCGTGGDGHPLCPIGYYCSMDSFTNTRLCCKLGSIGTKVYAPINESPFSSQKKNSSKELLTKQELPVNVDVSSTTTESLKPLSIAIPSIIEKKNTQKEYNHMMIKPINKGNNQKEIILEENPKLLIDDTHETNIKHIEDSSILMVDEVAMLEPKKILDKSACYISPSEGRGCREDEPVPKTNLQYFYSLKDKKCKLFFYRGCGGSINRFESKKICEALCMMD